MQKLSGEKWPLDDALYWVNDFCITDSGIWSVDHDSPGQIPRMVTRIQDFIESVAMSPTESLASWSTIVAIEDARNPDLPYLRAIAYAYYVNERERARQILREALHNHWEHTAPNFVTFRKNLEQDLVDLRGRRQ